MANAHSMWNLCLRMGISGPHSHGAPPPCNGHFPHSVQSEDNVVEVDECDADHISLITLIQAICQELSGSCDVTHVSTADYHKWAQIPWCGEKYGVCSDNELLELFSRFEEHGLDRIMFEFEDFCYMPSPPQEPPVLNVQRGYDPLGWCDMEADQLNYEGDSEKKDDDKDYEAGSEEEDTQFNEVSIIDEEDVEEPVEMDEGITQECMDCFEGYQSKSDDEYFTDSELESNQIFNSKEHMREIFKDYAIQEGIEFTRVKNDKVRQTYKVYNNKETKVKWTISKFGKLVKSNPSIDVKVIGDLLRKRFKVSVDIHRLYRAKNRALKELAKDQVKCVGYLRRYAYMLNQSNPSVVVHICTQDLQPTFQRMFVSFEPQMVGFLEGCRPFIGVDDCHLKGPFGEVLLSAVSLDTNSRLFPLAVCICEKETQDSWEWFLNNLKVYLNYPEGRNLTFMSDRQKGVIVALEIHFPFAHRRYCVRHIYVNFKLTYKGDHYKKLFWRAVRSSNIFDFKTCTEEIGLINPAAKNWLLDIHPQHWSRHAYDLVIRCDHVTNNMTETFNSMPTKQRKREPDEAPKVGRSGTVICKLCHQAGHNKKFYRSRNHKENEEVSVGLSSSHQPNQTPPPQSQVTQQLYD
ncbi:hypothetical protein Ddye_008288 [Dipteronia dyeriana]|uniref:MULE transposase domain-containing protein n=1 Tax=Dipteronia dyeriana TaxID=168575 RepID=A0AAD9X9P0_9ROSI|nr:hypothetical protein Ddye_008288 [Dipteronia dyeriana]